MPSIVSRVAVGVCVKNLPFWLSLRTLLRRREWMGKRFDRHPQGSCTRENRNGFGTGLTGFTRLKRPMERFLDGNEAK